jgi:flagellar operon protein (TIGR03826 family)
MDIRNCRRCNRIFQYKGSKYCSSCMIEMDDIFIKVRDYIYEHPEANILKVSQETGVEEGIILEFLREGRLELTSPSLDFVCERCERPIVSGRYCNECIQELDREMKKGLGEADRRAKDLGKDSKRMYIIDYYEKKRRR